MATPRLCTNQPEPQQEDFVPLPRTFDLLHQPADLRDALLIAVGWLDDAGCFGGHGARSVAQPNGGIATGISSQSEAV